MTHQPQEEEKTAGELPAIETPATRKVRPILAFLAAFLGLGLGYVYVGRIRLAIATFVASFGIWALSAWTRLIVSTATMLWLIAATLLLVAAISLVHPVVIAVRQRDRPKSAYNRWWVYVLWAIGMGALGVSVIAHRAQFFGYEPFRTPTESMSPTIERNEFFMTDTWRYKHHSPSNGEIVVFERPDQPGIKYVKRIVGVPGDRVEARDAVLYRNGEAVAEPYLHALRAYNPYGRAIAPTLVGPGQVFVLGDYRDNSLDSRAWGPIPIDQLHGRAEYIWLSLADGVDRWNRVGIQLRP
jgi:signal peptidase I